MIFLFTPRSGHLVCDFRYVQNYVHQRPRILLLNNIQKESYTAHFVLLGIITP